MMSLDSVSNVDRQAVDIVYITFIDWVISSWNPSYWEYARAVFARGHFTDNWSYWIDKILGRYSNEWCQMQMLITELWS